MRDIAPRYPELARFMRNFLETREWSVSQFSSVVWPITKSRTYDILEGRRCWDGWEVALIHKRCGIVFPPAFLRGEDRYGRQVKNLKGQMVFERMGEKQ